MAVKKKPLERVFGWLGGPSGVARALREQSAGRVDLTPWACSKWLRAGRLPRTDYTKETNYAELLERAVARRISAERLLENR